MNIKEVSTLKKGAIVRNLRTFFNPTDVIISSANHPTIEPDALFEDVMNNFGLYRYDSLIKDEVWIDGHVKVWSLKEFTSYLVKSTLGGSNGYKLQDFLSGWRSIIFIPGFVGDINAGVINLETGETFEVDFSKYALLESYHSAEREDLDDCNMAFVQLAGEGEIHVIKDIVAYFEQVIK